MSTTRILLPWEFIRSLEREPELEPEPETELGGVRPRRCGPRESARYGLSGVLLGEADQPGPVGCSAPRFVHLTNLQDNSGGTSLASLRSARSTPRFAWQTCTANQGDLVRLAALGSLSSKVRLANLQGKSGGTSLASLRLGRSAPRFTKQTCRAEAVEPRSPHCARLAQLQGSLSKPAEQIRGDLARCARPAHLQEHLPNLQGKSGGPRSPRCA